MSASCVLTTKAKFNFSNPAHVMKVLRDNDFVTSSETLSRSIALELLLKKMTLRELKQQLEIYPEYAMNPLKVKTKKDAIAVLGHDFQVGTIIDDGENGWSKLDAANAATQEKLSIYDAVFSVKNEKFKQKGKNSLHKQILEIAQGGGNGRHRDRASFYELVFRYDLYHYLLQEDIDMFLATIDGDNTWGTVVPSCIEDVRDLIIDIATINNVIAVISSVTGGYIPVHDSNAVESVPAMPALVDRCGDSADVDDSRYGDSDDVDVINPTLIETTGLQMTLGTDIAEPDALMTNGSTLTNRPKHTVVTPEKAHESNKRAKLTEVGGRIDVGGRIILPEDGTETAAGKYNCANVDIPTVTAMTNEGIAPQNNTNDVSVNCVEASVAVEIKPK